MCLSDRSLLEALECNLFEQFTIVANALGMISPVVENNLLL
jgi:hypothetical protein